MSGHTPAVTVFVSCEGAVFVSCAFDCARALIANGSDVSVSQKTSSAAHPQKTSAALNQSRVMPTFKVGNSAATMGFPPSRNAAWAKTRLFDTADVRT